jgi:predicted transcriptional regulator of viral defense system
MAKKMRVNATQLYPLAKRLLEQGKLERVEKGYRVAAGGTS